MHNWRVYFFVLAGTFTGAGAALEPSLIPEQSPSGYVQIVGVETGPFNVQLWRTNPPNLVPDIRFPLISPLAGQYRNIYAPSAVETPTGYRVFYGAWDGTPTGNDRLYSLTTDAKFQTLNDRHTVALPGRYQHVCNVNALRLEDGSFALFATVYPVTNKLNKPAFLRSDVTGTNWNNQSGEPYTMAPEDIVSIAGYNPGADINGMNVMLREAGVYRLYFGDFKNFTGVQRATSVDGRHFTYDAQVLSGKYAVNDVKTFLVGTNTAYLMGLHMNRTQLWYALSTDGLHFDSPITLLTNQSLADRYIVAQGWVTRGKPEASERKLLGVLYGAGDIAALTQNRIYARWFQKQVIFVTSDGTRHVGSNSCGPDRQLLKLPAGDWSGRFELYAEDASTLIGRSAPVTISQGQTYQLRWEN